MGYNASEESARAGYEVAWRERGYRDFTALNHFLEYLGLDPIHERTFNHYHDLHEAGCPSYVPINRFEYLGGCNA